MSNEKSGYDKGNFIAAAVSALAAVAAVVVSIFFGYLSNIPRSHQLRTPSPSSGSYRRLNEIKYTSILFH